jgi:hypothetical protein
LCVHTCTHTHKHTPGSTGSEHSTRDDIQLRLGLIPADAKALRQPTKCSEPNTGNAARVSRRRTAIRGEDRYRRTSRACSALTQSSGAMVRSVWKF